MPSSSHSQLSAKPGDCLVVRVIIKASSLGTERFSRSWVRRERLRTWSAGRMATRPRCFRARTCTFSTSPALSRSDPRALPWGPRLCKQ